MTLEPMIARQWIYEALAGNASLVALLHDAAASIYLDTIPQDETDPPDPPYALVTFQATTELRDQGHHQTLWADVHFTARGVVAGHSFTATSKAIAVAIDAALDQTSGVVDDGQVIGCIRTNPFTLTENAPEGPLRHFGGRYRLFSQEI